MKSYFLIELKYQLKQLWTKWSKLLGQGLAALAISIGTLVLWSKPTGQRLDIWMLQNFFSYRESRPAPNDILIVGIDDITYQKLDVSTRMPFPRRFMAEGLENLVAAKPKVIIVDARFPKEGEDPVAEARIEAALKSGPTTIWSGEIPMSKTGLIASDATSSSITMSSDARFRAAAKMELSMLISADYGMVYRITLDPAEAADLYTRTPLARPLVELANLDIIAPGPRDLINYYGGQGSINRISLYELLGSDVANAQQKVKDKVVFLGFQSIGRGRGQMDKDEYPVPVPGDQMFGVEIHANIVGNLMDRSWIQRSKLMREISFIYLSALVLAVLGIALTPEKAVPAIIAILTTLVLIAYRAFAHYQYWVSGVGVLLVAGIFTMLSGAFYHYVLIKSFKKYVRKTFKFDIEREI